MREVTALAGFVALGLSPSFLDWKQSPEERPKIVGFYVAAVVLIYLGAIRGR
jgi:hypothetical protein